MILRSRNLGVMAERRRVNIVPHTHWDREWYSPFQTFRLRLVDLVDHLLATMESDPSYARFLLDGQMAVIDDYLEVRPENEQRLRRLTAAGRLTCGPWYILMDEFLVSGETIVRNLQMGIERAAAFGGAMPVGYLPDMFGHIAQMPQILAQAGFGRAVVWRGVPSAVDKSAFEWVAPDGSTVRAEYLLTGYSEGASIASDAKQLVRRLEAYEDQHRSFLLGPILLMNGTDHQEPQPWLGRVVEEANSIQDRFELAITSLEEALDGAATTGLPTWDGELRSGARANLLMGVASNRVDVKQAAARSERALERLAEPLSTLFLPPERYPGPMLAIAWREMVRNSAHDSICACSHDEVVRAVLHRFAEARQIADGLTGRALAALAGSFADAGHYAVNPSARTRSGLIELVLPGEGHVEGAQVRSERSGLDLQLVLTNTEVRAILGQIEGYQIGEDAFVNAVEISEVEPGDDGAAIDVIVHVGPDRHDDLPVDEIKRDLSARMSLQPEGRVRIRLAHSPSRRVLARVEDVPGYGWKRYEPKPLTNLVAATEASGAVTLSNGLTTVVVEADGTFSIDGLKGFGRLVDSGDHGDTYNYSPPEHDTVVDTPVASAVRLLEPGPVRSAVEVVQTYVLPARIDDAARARVGEAAVEITSRIELCAGESFVRVATSFVNPCRDHRLRALFPLREPATASRAECAYAIVERGLEAEGGPSERALPTYPSRRFVQAGDITVAHEGLLEYELVDIEAGAAHSLALTLLRATGMLSRLTMLNRPLPAGPTDKLEGPQMIGPVQARYAIAVGEVDPYALAEDAFLPLHVVAGFGGGTRAPQGDELTVTGAEVAAVQRVGGLVEIRVFNPRDVASDLSVMRADTPARGHLVDLRGRATASFEGTVELAPFRIATLRLSP
jgi:mannosylglycerate hydrolase